MRPIDVVKKVAPHARQEYLTAFENGDATFKKYGITTPLRLAHFLAQTLEETGGYTIDIESGNYTAERIREVWPSRPEAVQHAHNSEALFNDVYGNRMGNGPPSSGDGFRYRGRGILQTTGKEAYVKYGQRFGVDFVNNPDLIFDPRYILLPALAEWTDDNCNALADQDNIREITHRVNGGYTNLAERERWLSIVKPIIDKVDLVVVPAPTLPTTHPSIAVPAGAAVGTGAAVVQTHPTAGTMLLVLGGLILTGIVVYEIYKHWRNNNADVAKNGLEQVRSMGS